MSVSHIGEVDERRLYARTASPSMFAYCTEVLHLSEAEAYLRIAAARASREHPMILAMLADGRLHLTAIAKLAPHLTVENREALLKKADHRSKREIEELVAELAPRPDAPAVMRKLPERRAQTAPVPALQVGPHGVAPAIELRLDGAASRSSPVRRESPRPSPNCVWTELPRQSPRGQAGPAVVAPLAPGRYKVHFWSTSSLVCRAHNSYLAEVDYGRRAMALHRRSQQRVLEPPRAGRQIPCRPARESSSE